MQCVTCGSRNAAGATSCASCGMTLSGPPTGDAVPFSPSLKNGAKLMGGQFAVSDVLGQGGFGITYKGGDMKLRRYVAIKEFFPQGCARHLQTVQPTGGMTQAEYQNIKIKFLEEARTLARFNHPGIVRVFATFEENNTAYMVMEFLEGHTLQKILDEKGSLPQKDAVGYIEKIGEALATVHAANLIHRDIKPDNIVITNDGRTVLIDFGTARAFASGKTVKQTAMLTPGYAPLEQYGQKARFGTYSDVYALGATLYHCLTGQLPPQATDRATGVELKAPDQINPYISREVSNAVMWAMQLKADARPQSVQEFLDALKAQAQPRSTMPTGVAPTGTIQLPSSSTQVPQTLPSNAPSQAWMQRTGESQLLTNAPPDQVLNALQQAFQSTGVSDVVVNRQAFTVTGKTGVSMQSWGQSVSANITSSVQGFCVTVGSSASGPQVTDWGRGRTEVQNVMQALENILRSGNVMPVPATPPPPIPSPHGFQPPAQGYTPYQNPATGSGMGENSLPLPQELRGFNWGAFWWNWLWAVAHQTWIGLIILLFCFIPFGALINLGICIWLGVQGNEFAWKNRRWQSVEQFKEVQRAWVRWALILLLLVPVGTVVLLTILGSSV